MVLILYVQEIDFFLLNKNVKHFDAFKCTIVTTW